MPSNRPPHSPSSVTDDSGSGVIRQLQELLFFVWERLLCRCLSEETLKAVSPFYLVSMPGEVKDHVYTDKSTLECVTVVDSTMLPPPPNVALS